MDETTTTKILLAGVAAGALISGLGLVSSYRIERGIRHLQRTCVTEGEKDKTPSWELVCDPVELTRLGPLVGTQEQIAIAQRRLWRW